MSANNNPIDCQYLDLKPAPSQSIFQIHQMTNKIGKIESKLDEAIHIMRSIKELLDWCY